MNADYHQRAMALYKQLPHWFEPGIRETASDRLIRYTHLIDGIVRLLVDMTTPEIKVEPLTEETDDQAQTHRPSQVSGTSAQAGRTPRTRLRL